MRKITACFLRGLLIFVPVALTIFVVVYAITRLDGLLRDFFRITIPGVGLAITLAAIFLIGLLASNFAGRWFFSLIDRLFARLPLVKLLYSSLKDFIGAFAGEKKSFDKPALVELTPGGPLAVGFITRESLDLLNLADHVAVYFPQSYNFAGSVLLLPADRVRPLDIDSSEAMAFVVSGGVTGGHGKQDAAQLPDGAA
ncbi:MAG: DUF502 domain-containing protein [Phycisphaerae bacterium]|nr:DUF502 domain-containing protein [Phycisphaerae bacterium]